MDILQPPGNQWLDELMESKRPLPAGVRVVRYEDGECEVFESGTLPHRSAPKPGHEPGHNLPN